MSKPRTIPEPSPRALAPLLLLLSCFAASCGGGGGGPTDPDPPSLPAPLVLHLVLAAPDAVDLAWTDVATGEDGFLVQRADDAGGVPGPFAEVGQVGAGVEAFQDASVLQDTPYWYQVRTLQGGAQSPPSNLVAVLTAGPSSGPTAPANLQVGSQSSSAIGLGWDDLSSDEDGFAIERAKDVGGSPGAFKLHAQVAANVASFVDAGLSANKSWWYRVRAFKGQVASAHSNQVQASTVSGPSVGARTDTITVSGNQSGPRLLIEDDGRYFLSMVSAGGGNTLLLAFAADDTLLWQREFGFGPYPPQFHRATDGDLWVIGSTWQAGQLVGKFRASDGAVGFANLYGASAVVDEPTPNAASLASIPLIGATIGAIAGDGSVLWSHQVSSFPYSGFVGRKALSDGGHVYYGGGLARLGATGAELWERTLQAQGFLTPFAVSHVHECSDGGLLVLGSVIDEVLWAGKLDAAGQLTGQVALEVVGYDLDEALWVEDALGGLLGHFDVGGVDRPLVLRFDDLGALRWSTRVDTPGLEITQSIFPRPAGGCLIVGRTTSVGGGLWVVALDQDGDLEWERILGGSGVPVSATALRATPDGGVVLAGSAGSYPQYSPWCAKVDAQGQLVADRAWVGEASGLPTGGFDLLPDGRSVLSGSALVAGSGSYELWTALFDPLGDVLGSVRVSVSSLATGVLDSVSVGLRPDGKLAFALRSQFGSSDSDIRRTVLEDPSQLGLAGQGGCAAASASVPGSLVAKQGVALTSDPTVDVTATYWVIATDNGWVNPGNLTSQPFSISNFQGTAAIVESCGP